MCDFIEEEIMRALLRPEIDWQERELSILDDSFHHLVKVARARIGDKVLILDGIGNGGLYKITAIERKSLNLLQEEKYQYKKKHSIDLAIALPKKEATEEILRHAVECGVGKVWPLLSEFSQYSFRPSSRVDRILQGAMEQSNNPYLMAIEEQKHLMNFSAWSQYQTVFCCSTQRGHNLSSSSFLPDDKILVLIGPEAGFSEAEEKFLAELPNIQFIQFPTPILRSPTASAVALGAICSRVVDA